MDKVVLYTIHCPKCGVVQKKLEQKNIEFEMITDPTTVTEIGKANGISSAPILKVGENYLDFSKAVKWIGEQ